ARADTGNPKRKPKIQTKNTTMAILRSTDGKFYELADDQLEGKLIPAEQIKEKLDAVGVGPAEGPVGPGPQLSVPGAAGQVVIQIYPSAGDAGAPEAAASEGGDEVEAHGYCWRRNCFSNYGRRNCWRNSSCGASSWRNSCGASNSRGPRP